MPAAVGVNPHASMSKGAVPQDVHEADETDGVAHNHPAEAETIGLCHPVLLGLIKETGCECQSMEGMDLAVVERSAPHIGEFPRGHYHSFEFGNMSASGRDDGGSDRA